MKMFGGLLLIVHSPTLETHHQHPTQVWSQNALQGKRLQIIYLQIKSTTKNLCPVKYKKSKLMGSNEHITVGSKNKPHRTDPTVNRLRRKKASESKTNCSSGYWLESSECWVTIQPADHVQNQLTVPQYNSRTTPVST